MSRSPRIRLAKFGPVVGPIIATVAEGRPRERLIEQFQRHGVDPSRLVLEGRLPRARFNELMMQADIALDSFPYNGTTTTCHALWMGLPVIALAGRAHVSRVGVSMLSNLGLPELVAGSSEEYIRIAAALSRDEPRLAELRSSLRQRMRSSPLTDGRQYAIDLESAFRDIWRRWCESRPGK